MEVHFVHHRTFVFLGNSSNLMKLIQCETRLIIRKRIKFYSKTDFANTIAYMWHSNETLRGYQWTNKGY